MPPKEPVLWQSREARLLDRAVVERAIRADVVLGSR
jgi:hypothetical protein